VTRRSDIGDSRPGRSPTQAMKNSTVPTPPQSTVTSKTTGANAGHEFHGLPPTLIGQS
jgi:hypothetical protein